MRIFAACVAFFTLASLPLHAMALPKAKEVQYEHQGVKLTGYFVYDDERLANSSGTLPAVMIVPEWWGQNEYVRRRARMFADLGYCAFVADMYGTGVLASTPQEAARLAGPFYTPDAGSGRRDLMRARARAAYDAMIDQPEVNSNKTACVGYCFGGSVSLELARSGAPLNAVISYHGGLGTPKPEDARMIAAKVLICHGADDPMVKDEEVAAFHDEMRAAKVDYVFVAFGGAVHAFTNPEAGARGSASDGMKGVLYNEAADKRSWEVTKAFLAEAFR